MKLHAQSTDPYNINNNHNGAESVQSVHSIHSHQSSALSVAFELNPIEESVLLIKPHATAHVRDIEKYLVNEGFYIGKSRPINMPRFLWADFYRQYENETWFDSLCQAMAEDQIIAYILYRTDCVNHLRKCVGATDPAIAAETNPNCLRAIYGIDIIRNGFHCSKTEENVIKERAELFFQDVDSNNHHHHNNSNNKQDELNRIFVIIKPNAAKYYGDNIRTHLVGNGFEIVREKVVHFNEIIYQNLAIDISSQYFDASVKYLASDQIIVMIVEKMNGYQDIEKIVGHRDPAIAIQQQADSIRAIYGRDIVQNAIEISLNKEMYAQNREIFFDDHHDPKKLKKKRSHRNKKQNGHKNKKEKCLLIIKPHISNADINSIQQILIKSEFEILSQRHSNLPYDAFVAAFENDHQIDPNIFDTICNEWSSGEITIFIVSKINAFQSIETLVGPDDPEIARSEAPSSIRARFGQDRIRNCCWYSQNAQQYHDKLQHFEY